MSLSPLCPGIPWEILRQSTQTEMDIPKILCLLVPYYPGKSLDSPHKLRRISLKSYILVPEKSLDSPH